MKKIGRILVLVALLIISYLIYQEYQRRNMSQGLLVSISDEIDQDYYNNELVLEYYHLADQLNGRIRKAWHNHLKDIRDQKENDPDFINSQVSFNNEHRIYKTIEKKLIFSKNEKLKGRTNQDIFTLENCKQYRLNSRSCKLNNWILFEYGDTDEAIKIVQKKLSNLGYTLPVDGIFLSETETTVKSYQTKYGMEPNGKIDLPIWLHLFGIESKKEKL
ncbi:MAG: peptidoglycan-binding protein [Flavobacteriales bacterium]|jgi:hypothetical protein|nr:peptidoglycan-binding protein [Flavobacteriales bacterium]